MNFAIHPAEEKLLSVSAVFTNDDCNALVKDMYKHPLQVCNVLICDNSSTAGGKSYSNLSGYDVLAEGLGLIGRNSFETQLFGIVIERLECLKKSRSISFFLPTGTLKDILFLFESEFPSLFARIDYKGFDSGTLSFGDEPDFAIISALLISFCHRYGFGDIDMKLLFREKEIVFNVSASLKRGTEISDILKNEERWLYFINLLAEGNIWRFETEGKGNSVEFSLNMFVCDENDSFILRDDRNSHIIASLARLAVKANE